MIKRPILVWIIFVWFVYSATIGLLQYIFIINNPEIMPEIARAYFYQLNMVDIIISIVVSWSVALGAIMLFFLRGKSVQVFAAAIIINIISVIYHIVIKDWGDVKLNIVQMYSPLVLLLIPIGAYLYARKLAKESKLK